jgi:hypothetical protein
MENTSPSRSGLQTVLEVLKIQSNYWPVLASSFIKLQSQARMHSIENKSEELCLHLLNAVYMDSLADRSRFVLCWNWFILRLLVFIFAFRKTNRKETAGCGSNVVEMGAERSSVSSFKWAKWACPCKTKGCLIYSSDRQRAFTSSSMHFCTLASSWNRIKSFIALPIMFSYSEKLYLTICEPHSPLFWG